MSHDAIDPQAFLDITRPALASGSAGELAKTILAHWKPADLCPLLNHANVNVRRVVAIGLGLVGDRSVVGCLGLALRDEDEQVNQMAEHGLWSIWFRSGDCKAARPFRQGVAMLSAESYPLAIEKFNEAIAIDPRFAEAYNQCAIAQYFLKQWRASLANCQLAVKLVPVHFGAIAGMGHCHMQLNDLDQALECYRKAIRINPRMPAIARAITQLEPRVRRLNDASGIFSSGAAPVA
jgi:tetratricopeptide (TPR) repeat protein